MVVVMKLLENKFTHTYASGANAIAIQVDHHKIKRYILEYSDLRHIGVCHDDECECGCMDSHLHETETIRNEVTPSDIVSDTWITVLVDERLYAVHKPFFEIIYDGDISLLRIEIEENYDDFVGFSVILCPNCGKWSVCD